MIHSLLQTLSEARIFLSVASRGWAAGPVEDRIVGFDGDQVAWRTISGRPSWRNFIDRLATSCFSKKSWSLPVASNVPRTVASTSSLAHKSRNVSHFDWGTARIMRSWASEIQISVYDRP